MTCVICGARCGCKKAPKGLCCSCHKHKVRRIKVFTFRETMGVTKDDFERSFEKHRIDAEQRVLEYP